MTRPTESDRSSMPVALISPPVVDVRWPSLAIGLLKGILLRLGVECHDYYLSVAFAKQIGVSLNQRIASHDHLFLGDFIFSSSLRRWERKEVADYRKNALRKAKYTSLDDTSQLLNEANKIRDDEVPKFLDELSGIEWKQYQLIGISSTFQQQAATLAIAKRIRSICGSTRIVLGGANLQGDMGVAWLENTPEIDFVCNGEGDETLPLLVRAINEELQFEDVPNLVYRRTGGVHLGTKRLTSKAVLSELPIPEFDAYFSAVDGIRHTAPEYLSRTIIPVETSRGCWWGQKHHCIFCGLNGSSMQFRSKTPEAVVSELSELSRRHRCLRFQVVDNILDMAYFKTLLPKLAQSAPDFQLFYEVKANLTVEQLRLLKSAGVNSLQPGLESFDNESLRVMKKGVSSIQNIFLLKSCKIQGIVPSWNFLYGFPNENSESVTAQLRLMSRLRHYQAPEGYGRLLLERFSPMFDHPDEFGVKNITVATLYDAIYRTIMPETERTSYFFDYESGANISATCDRLVAEAVKLWHEGNDHRVVFDWFEGVGFLEFADGRDLKGSSTFYLDGLDAEIYRAIDCSPQKLESVRRVIERSVTIDQVRTRLDYLVESGCAVEDSGRYLGLAIRGSAPGSR